MASDLATGVESGDRLRKLYDRVTDKTNRDYRYPVQEAILEYGGMNEPRREALIGEARATGVSDARSGLLLNDVKIAANLEELLSRVPDGMGRVAGAKDDIEAHVQQWNEELLQAAGESSGLADDPKHIARVEKAQFEVDCAEAEMHASKASGKRTKSLLLIGLVVAIIGIAVDAILLGAAIEVTEQFTTLESRVFGFLAAIVLAGFAFFAGNMFGKGRPGGRVAADHVPDSMAQTHNNLEQHKAGERRTHTRISWALVAMIVAVFVFLAGLRIAEWSKTLGDSGATTGGLFGSGQVEDNRSQSIWVQGAILLMALLSLLIFWFEGFQMALIKRREAAERDLAAAKKALEDEQFRSQMAAVFTARAEENAADLKKLDCDIAKAIQSLEPLWTRVIDGYKGAAITWLQAQKDEKLLAQLPEFQNIDGSIRILPERVSRPVQHYLDMDTHECVAALARNAPPDGSGGN